MFKHPRYNGFTINNDILLIKLASPAQMSMRVSPVCVAETGDNFPGGMKCVTSGWGLTRYNGDFIIIIMSVLHLLRAHLCSFSDH